MLGEAETLSNALERCVMKRKDEVLVLCKVLAAMIRVNRVHTFKRAKPRRALDLEDSIWSQTACLERMARERFVVRWAEHVGVSSLKRDEGAWFVGVSIIKNPYARTVPSGGALFKVIREA
jgi:hypothetical protein